MRAKRATEQHCALSGFVLGPRLDPVQAKSPSRTGGDRSVFFFRVPWVKDDGQMKHFSAPCLGLVSVIFAFLA